MTDELDYMITNVEKARFNGREVVLFQAYKLNGRNYQFAGKFKAPAGTSRHDLWRFVDAVEENEEDKNGR